MIINIPEYINQCAPQVAENTMMAIIKTESNGNPWAISLNRGHRLMYQPKSYKQAVAWVKYLEKYKYNFDVGIAQVNIKNIHKFGFRAVDALDPCLNLKLGAYILQSNFSQAIKASKTQQEALLKAISAYNTGNYHRGFYNGYVDKVIYNAKSDTPYIPLK